MFLFSFEKFLNNNLNMFSKISVIFRVYCADHTYCTLRLPLKTTADVIRQNAADKLGLRHDMILVELKSTGLFCFLYS